MVLAAGSRLGAYEIIAALGRGGMGEVYRARDTRLGRDVAIKILPAQVAQDPDRRSRFEREARAVAALSHPNILAIHDVGTHDGTAYAVTELLEGETLRQRVQAGATSPRKAIEIAVQIANGLAAAHDKGIVHRDLKPENVFVTHDGRVKILDFGLAVHPAREEFTADSPTIAGGTEPGVILGTVGYMSPEQVRGARVDHRTDIFALGAVVFELLTGRRAFQRDTAAETMTAILNDDVPELSANGRQIPQPLERIIRRCLEKNPHERMQSSRDIAIALDAVSGSDVSTAREQPTPPPRRRWSRAVLAATLVVFGAAAGFLGARSLASRTVGEEPPRYTRLTFRRGEIRNARFTPDGQSIVYSAIWDSEPHRVYSVRLDNPRSAAPAVVDGALLAVSRSGDMAIAARPDRRDVFTESGTLAQTPLGGGAPREVLEHVTAAALAADGRMAAVRQESGRTRLEFPIGTVLYETAGWISSPRFSSGDDRIAFHEHPLHEDDRGWPAVVDVATRAKRNLTPEQGTLSGLAWTPDNSEVCFASDSIIRCVAVGKAAVRLVIRGASRFMLHDIASDGRILASAYMGRAAQAAGQRGGRESDLSWQDGAFPVDLSPDGTRLLFSDLGYGVHLRPLAGGLPVRLGDGIACGFSSDGRFVLSLVPSVPTRLTLLPTGPGATRTLSRGTVESHNGAAWMPDGRRIVISGSEPGRASRLYLQNLDGGDPRPFTGDGVRLIPYVSRAVSPDGRFVIAVSPEQAPLLYPIDGGTPRPINALGQDLMPIGWSDTPQTIFAKGRGLGRFCRVFKIELSTGQREALTELGPRDPTGAPLVIMPFVTRDGQRYAYSVLQLAGDLFLIDGALR